MESKVGVGGEKDREKKRWGVERREAEVDFREREREREREKSNKKIAGRERQ